MNRATFSVMVVACIAAMAFWNASTANGANCDDDTTPPTIYCSLEPTKNANGTKTESKNGGRNGFFLIRFSARDNCDRYPKVYATLCGFRVANCEVIKYTQAPGQKSPKLVMEGNGTKHIICAHDPKLVVKATDVSGNTATKICTAQVPPMKK